MLEDEMFYLGDGRKLLIYNTKGKVINVEEETYRFLKYIETGQVSDNFTRQLDSSVSMAKMNRKWRAEFMKTFCHDVDVRREGIEIGQEIGKEIGKEIGISQGQDMKLIALISNKLRKGKSPELIADELEDDLDKVRKICDIADKCAPGYDAEEIYDLYVESCSAKS